MNRNEISRREALKLLGSIGTSILGFRMFRRGPSLARHIGDEASNFIVMVFDTLSARHMSLHGYTRGTTPNIDKFASVSTVYHRHYSASNFTQSSTASLLTGVYPWSHRSLEFFEVLLHEYEEKNIFSLMAPGYETIAYTHNLHAESILDQFRSDIRLLKPIEDLVLFEENRLEHVFDNDQPVGEYASKRWLQNFFPPSYSLFLNPVLTALSSFTSAKLNSQYRDQFPVGLSERDGFLFKMEDAIDWIIEVARDASSLFFGYFHLLPPHEDYKPRVEFFDKFAGDSSHLISKPEHFFSDRVSDEAQQINCQRYDEYIAYVDAEFGRLVRELETQGTLDNTYLILTSDHGQLLERGMHGHLQPALYESVIHVPLIIHAPGQTQAMDSYFPTSSIDLLPTLLHLAGEPLPAGLGGSLLPFLGGADDPQRIVFSMHARRNAKRAPLQTATFAAIQWPFKLVQYRGYRGLQDYDELFNLEEDPEELQDLAQQNPSIVSRLSEELREQQSRAEEHSLKT